MNIGGVELSLLPPVSGVSVSGSHPVNERTTIEGRIVATRSPFPGSRKISVSIGEKYVITTADANAIQGLADSSFSFSLTGYAGAGSYGGCVFEEPPNFQPYPGRPEYSQGSFTVYIPQEG